MLQTRQDALGERFQLQRAAFEAQPFPDLGVRKDRLKRLLALTERHEADICAAIDADNCVRGAVCIEGTCEAICDPGGRDPVCDAQHTCVTHPDVFQYGSDTPYAAGVCE